MAELQDATSVEEVKPAGVAQPELATATLVEPDTASIADGPAKKSDAGHKMEMDDVKHTEDALITTISNLDGYAGANVAERTLALTKQHDVVIFSKSFCPFCVEVKKTFASRGVPIHVVEINQHGEGHKIHNVIKAQTKFATVPNVFIKGKHIGGCSDVKNLEAKGDLDDLIADLITRQQVLDTGRLETVKLAPIERGQAQHPLLWFPNTVNNNVVRGTGVLVTVCCVISIIFREDLWGKYMAAFLLTDFSTRFAVGSSASVLGMLATFLTVRLTPDFRPGPPKQFASACGLLFSLISTVLYFSLEDPDAASTGGAIVMGMLMGAAGLEGFADFCLGCLFFGWGIRFKLIPGYVYTIHNNTRNEINASWHYKNDASKAAAPTFVDTDPKDASALKYKVKTDEWTKDDFHLIRNMQVGYFGMPVALAGLSFAWKGAGIAIVEDAVFHVIGIIAAVVYCIMFVLYAVRLVMYRRKCATEWSCPLRSPAFGLITISLMLFSMLIFDQGGVDEARFARVLWWLGSVPHMLMTISKFGEWVGKRLELEHVHATWLILPLGNMVAAAATALVTPLESEGVSANNQLGHFFYSFAFFMWLALFAITLLKMVTTHNSDDRIRHSAFIWVAAPAIASVAHYYLCANNQAEIQATCATGASQLYYVAVVLVMGLAWATLPYINFFGRATFDMGYWTEVFALDTLVVAANLHYSLFGFHTSEVLMYLFLAIASIANVAAFLHTLASIARKRDVFTPSAKWGPLSFMKLTHEAFRGAVPKLRKVLHELDADLVKTVHMFAALYSQFAIVHAEHANHEDELIFKTFNDFFAEHAKKYNDDHTEDRVLMDGWQIDINNLLSNETDGHTKRDIALKLKDDMPKFLTHLEEHLLGEEDHLNPIGKRYIPLEIQKEVSRRAFELTNAKHQEVIIPFIVNNLPRHMQRVRYIKCLTWAMPERAQQIGAIVYRNSTAVMWERLRVELPEIVPRGTTNWRRYY